MIDIVIPLRNDSTWNNNEIRYCLRSVEKHLTGIRDVYIIGHKPKFLQNVVHIPMGDSKPYVPLNIRWKLLTACAQHSVSENFLFMNDDHYIMESYKQTVFYHCGLIEEILDTSTNSVYKQIARNTIIRLGSNHYNYDIHTPIIFNKQVFLQAMWQWDWDGQKDEWNPEWGGYLIKSVYANLLMKKFPMFHFQYAEDGKIRGPISHAELERIFRECPVVSSGDIITVGLRSMLEEMFPEKSKYEI
jgi:hypothetical protein